MLERSRFVFDSKRPLRSVPVMVRAPDGSAYHALVDADPLTGGDTPARLIVARSMVASRRG